MATVKRLSDLRNDSNSDFAKFKKKREEKQTTNQKKPVKTISESEKLNQMKADPDSDYAKFIKRRTSGSLNENLRQKQQAQIDFENSEENVGFWDAMLPGGATPSEYSASREKKKQYEKEVEEAAAQVAAYEQFWQSQQVKNKSSAEIDAFIAKGDEQISQLEDEKVGFFEAMKPGGVTPSERRAIKKEKEAEIKKIESQQATHRAVRDEKKSHEMTDELPEDVKQMLDEFNRLAYETEGTDWAGVASSFAGTPGAGGNAVQRSSADMRIEKIKTELTDRGYDNWVELAEYRKYITDKEAALEQEETWSKVAEEHPVIASAGARAMALPSAMAGLYGTVKQSETTADFKGGTPYTPYYGGVRARQAIDSTITEGFEDGDILSAEAKAFLYAAGTSAADSMMASIAGGSLGLGKLTAGEVLLGVGAANSVIVNASEKGMTREQAMTTAAVAMASEILFEHASLGKLGAFAGTGEATFKAATKDLLKNSFVNMTEEMATEITNLTFDYYYNGGMSDYYKAYESYLMMGMSEEEAQRAATNDMVMQVVQAGASGALIGGVFSGVNTAESAVAYNSQLKDAGKQIVKEGKTESILAGASDVKDNEGLRKLAAEIERNKNATSGKDFRNIGKLAQGLDEATTKDRSSLIKAAVEKRLTALGEKDGIDVKAEAIVKTLENQTVSKKEKAILKDGKYTTRVINEMTDVFGLHSSGWTEGLEGEVEALNKRRYNPDIEGYKSKEEKPTQEASSEEGITDTTEKAKLKAEVLNIVDETEASDAEKNAKEEFKAVLIEENQDAEVFDAGFELYYESGKSGGYEFNEVKGNPNVSESFTDYQRQQAFELGERQKLKETGKAKYKGDTVSVFAAGYSGKSSVNSYAKSFDIFYSEGVHSALSFEQVMEKQGSLLKYIDESVARKAFDEGRGTVKPKEKAERKRKTGEKGGSYVSKTAQQEEIDILLTAVAKKLKTDITRVQRLISENGAEANAQIDLETGKITSSASSSNEYQSIVHEIVHYAYAYGKMTEVEKAVKDYFSSKFGVSELESVLRKYEKGYKDLDRNGITEEFTADALAGMFSTDEGVNQFLDWLQNESSYSQSEKKSIIEKLTDWLLEIIDAVKELIEEGSLNSVAERFARQEADRFSEIREMFLKVLDEVEGVEESRIITNEGDFRQSLKLNPVIKEGQREFIKSKRAFVTSSELKEAHRVIDAMVDVMIKHSSILPEDKIGKVLTKNGSYDISVENTTICLRTLAYNEFIDKVQQEIGRPLTQMESFLVSQKLYDIATDPQCLYCYVSLDRKAFNSMLIRYLQERDTVIAKYNSSDKSADTVRALYKEFLAGRKDTDNMKNRFNAWLDYVDNGTQLLSLADVATEERQSKIAAEGGVLAEQLKEARKYAQSASWAKIQKNYIAYKDEILKLGDRVAKNLNQHYGLRWYSFSDYSPAFIVENMQQITDAAIRGLKGLSYTKDTDFAKIFAPSGMNINISVFVKSDGKGGFYIDQKQSASLEEAIELRKQYENVGIVATVTDDDALRWAGEQEWSDVIIPFHIVRTGTNVAEYYKWLNYTAESADKIKDKNLWDAYVDSLNIKSENARKKVSKNIYPSEHQNDRETYLNLCERRGLSPRFARFIGEGWYMKLVNETRLSAGDSSTLKPKFNLEAARESFERFIEKGGYEGGWYKEGVDVAAEAKAVAKDVLESKKANEVSYGRQDGFSAEEVMASRKSNRSHMKSSLKESLEWVDFEGDDLAAENRSLVKKNTELERINEELRVLIRHPGVKHFLSQTGIQKVARYLKSEYKSTISVHKLSGELNEAYSYLANDYTPSWETIQVHFERIAEMILNESKFQKPDIDDGAKEILRELRSVNISLNDAQKAEISSVYGTYNNFRKRMMGSLVLSKDGISLDSRWQELSDMYPVLFPKDTSDTDQPIILVEAIKALRSTYADEYGFDRDSAKDMIITELTEKYYEVPETKYISEDYALKLNKIKATYSEKLREAKNDFRRNIRLKEKKRANIIRQVKRLDRLLRNPKRGAPSAGTNKYDQKYVHLTNIPEGLQRTVIDFCSVFIDNDAGVFSGITKRDNISQREKRIEALQKEYDLLRSSGNYIGASVAEEMKPKLDRIAKIMADKRLSRLSVEELDTIIEVTDHLLTIINNQVEMWVGGKKEKVTSIGNQAIRHAEELGQHKHPDLPGYDFTEKWTADNLKPIYFFEKIGGPLERLFKEILYKGQRDYARNVNQAAAFMDEISKKFDYQSWVDEKELTLETKQGHTLKLTKSQAMHIYATVKRELLSGKESEHLMAGGIVFENEIEADTESGSKKKLTSNVWKYKKSDGSAHRISIDDMTAIANYLTEEQRTFVDTVVGYLSKDMAALGNEVSMELYGIRMFDEKYYIPFNSAKNFIYRQMGEQGEAMLRNESFTKRTVHGAKNPLVVGDFMEVAAGHIERMCMYNSMVMPLENFSKIWNYQQVASSESSESTKSVRSTFETAFGKNNAQYVDTLLKDINGGINTDGREKSIGKLLSNFKKTAVLGSASVVIQQPSAIVRAFSEIDVKYFAFSSFDDRKKAWEKALKYSSTALLKDIGGFDTVSGRGTVDWLTKKEYKGKDKLLAFFKDSQFRDDILAWGPAFADRITWAHIWAACEREVAEKRSLLGEELYKATGERFDEVINKTQVYDSVLSRSAHMRSKTTTMQSLTAFMAEPTTQVNMLASALWDAKRGEKKKAMKKVASVVASQLFNAILVSLIYSMRDDDEDKTLVEKYIASVTENFLGSLNPMTMVPIFKDLWSMLEGYSIERSDMAVYSNIIDAAKALSNDNKTTLDKITGVVGSVGDALGLPLKNIIREGYAVVNTVESIKGVTDTTGKGIFYAIEDELLPALQTLKLWKPSTKDERLYAAFIDGDKKMYNRLASQYSKGSQIKSALTKQIGERCIEGVIDENQAIAQLQRLGYSESDAYYELRKMTEPVAEEEKGDTNADFFDFDSMQTLQGKTDAEINEEKQKAEAEGEEYSASGNYSWLEEALESGDKASIQQEVNDLKNRGVSEDDINSRIKSWIKKNDSEVSAEAEKYKSGDLSSFESTVSSVAGKYGIDQSYVAGAIRSAAEVNSKTIEGTIYALGDLHVSIGSTDTGKTAAISKAIVEAKTQAYILDGETRTDAQKKAKQSVSQSLTGKWKPIYLASGPAERNRIRQQLYATGVYDNLTELDEKLKGWREEA